MKTQRPESKEGGAQKERKLNSNSNSVKYGIKKLPNTKQKQIIKTVTPPTFAPDEFENIEKFMKENGYVVVRDIISDEEHSNGLNLFWDMMVQLNPNIKRNDYTTWTNKQWPGRFADGISTQDGIGQSEFMWFNRTRPKYIKLFQHLLGEDHLSVSFDGFISFRPEIPTTNVNWPHVDQNLRLLGSADNNIQGAINYYPVTKDIGGFCCVPKSHLTWEEYLIKYLGDTVPPTHGHMIPPTDPRLKDLAKIILPAKSAVLWYGKTIHCSTCSSKFAIQKDPTTGKVTLDRLAALVSYCERNLVTEKIIAEKKKTYEKGKSTTHWARLCVVQKPPRWGRPKNADVIQTLKPKNLNELEWKLIL